MKFLEVLEWAEDAIRWNFKLRQEIKCSNLMNDRILTRDREWHDALEPIFGRVRDGENELGNPIFKDLTPWNPAQAKTSAPGWADATSAMLFDRSLELMAAKSVALEALGVDWFGLPPETLMEQTKLIRVEYERLMALKIGQMKKDHEAMGAIEERPQFGIRTKTDKQVPKKVPQVWEGSD